MGWFFTRGATRRDVIAELLEESTSENGVYNRVLRHCLRGNVMYVLHESGPSEDVRRWIGVYLLDREKDYGWGYKPMDESMGPYYYGCPVSYLDQADEPVNETAVEWREKVRQLAAERARKKPQKGEHWLLCNGQVLQITSVRPLVGVTGGTQYRIPRRMLHEKVTP